ncbi:MAG TPA: RNA ligase [Candidatus Saccharimonadales bacterium]
MKLLVQEFLENHSFDDLIREHGVYASFSKSGHKFSLNYDQIEAKENDPLAQECRGLVLACENGVSLSPQSLTLPGNKTTYNHLSPGKTHVLAYPMKRFFNHGQGSAADIDWSDPDLTVLEKLDGTLCIVYWDKFTNIWCVATRSVSEADLLMDNGLFTFRTLFEKAVEETSKQSFQYLTDHLDKETTYCFELTTPYNRIVVNYPNSGVTLLAARKLSNLREVNPNDVAITGIPVVQAHTYNTIDELVTWVSSLDPSQHEGVVVKDSQHNRIKIKNAAYVAASKLRDTLATSPRNCLELILLGKEDDAASFLPQEILNNLLSIKDKYAIWIKHQEELAQTIIKEAGSIASDKKTFALTVQKYKPDISAAMFSIYDGKANSIREFIYNNRKNGTWSNSFLDKILFSVST